MASGDWFTKGIYTVYLVEQRALWMRSHAWCGPTEEQGTSVVLEPLTVNCSEGRSVVEQIHKSGAELPRMTEIVSSI
jgi:hypothetical protein